MSLAFLLPDGRSALEALLASSSSGPAVLGSALGAAFVLGAAHALTPGHGKAIVAAYLVGSRGRVADAVYLGGIVTVTHTATVFLLGLATLYASQQVPLDRVYPWLSLASGALVTAIGAWLTFKRVRSYTHPPAEHTHEHAPPHNHSHPHHHSHSRANHESHRGGLLSLGISGGLVPCPEALVVLLISISLRRVAFGLAILVSFSIGLAAILIGIGILMVLAGPLLAAKTGEGPWLRRISVGSAALVTVLGLVIAVQAARAV